MTDLTGQKSMVVEEEVIHDSAADPDIGLGHSASRRERTRVVRDDNREHRERVVEDLGAERRAVLGKVNGFIWLLSGLLQAAIALRVALKLIAANPANAFAQLVYGFTDLFLWPFQNLVANPADANGMTLEITSLIAMAVYALLAWLTIRLLAIVFSPSKSRSVSIYRREEL